VTAAIDAGIDEFNPVFKDHIDYLAGRSDGIDIAFLSIFRRRGGGIVNRGDLYATGGSAPE